MEMVQDRMLKALLPYVLLNRADGYRDVSAEICPLKLW